MNGFNLNELNMDGNAINPNQIIRASAGTGKTFQLSNRYLTLLLQGCSPDRILATTFTRKAAGEILSRVLSRLAGAAASETECLSLSNAIGMPLTVDQCQTKIREVTSKLHRVRVGTLDSFFGKVAHSFSLEIGLPPRWDIADSARDHFLRGRGIERLLGDDGEVPEAEAAPKLVRMLAKGELKRGINEVLHGAVNDAFSLFQASEKAAWTGLRRRQESDESELEAALEDLRTCDCSDAGLKPSQVAKFELKRDETYRLAINDAWDTMLKSGLMPKIIAGEETFNRVPIPPHLLSVLLQLKDHLRNHFLNQTASINESTYTLLKRFGSHYNQLKVDHGNFLFDDLPRLLTQIVNQDAGNHVDFRIDSHIDHLLLDEFQDTSRVQWEALQPFAKLIVEDESQSKSIFCVGDSKQAIYGWRGGMPEIFERISAQFDVRESSLDQSFRSAQPIIDAVNSTFQHMPSHENLGTLEMGVNQWCEKFPPHSTARRELKGYAEVRVTATLQEGDKAIDVALRTAVELAAELYESHPGRSIGLLVRSNNKVAHAIGQFKQLGIPASEEGGNPLTDSAAVLLICSLLRMADHPGDTVSAFHVCHSVLAAQYGLSPETNRKGARIISAAETVRQQLLDRGYGECIDGWAKQLQNQCNDREWRRVQQLVTLAYRHETTLLPRDFVTLVETEKVSDPTTATIRVMNVHQSKGLQFDIVVLGELEGRLNHTSGFVAKYNLNSFEAEQVCQFVGKQIRSFLPSRYQEMHDDFIARLVNETLCILYVAMTRAVHALHMIVVPTENEKASQTLGGLLRAALCENRELKAGTIAYQLGDVNWHEKSSAKTPATESDLQVTAVNLPPITLPTDQKRSVQRRLRPTTPSRLEGGNSMRLRPRVNGQNDALLMGTLFHAWLEQIEWLENGVPTGTDLHAIASQIGVTDRALSMATNHFSAALESKTLKSILTREQYTTVAATTWGNALPSPLDWSVHNEQRISVRRDDSLLNGSIDRLIVARHQGKIVAAEVIDFKTDRLGSGAKRPQKIESSVAYYLPQMLAYRDAVSTMLRLSPENITMRLAFVLENEVVDVGRRRALLAGGNVDQALNAIDSDAIETAPAQASPTVELTNTTTSNTTTTKKRTRVDKADVPPAPTKTPNNSVPTTSTTNTARTKTTSTAKTTDQPIPQDELSGQPDKAPSTKDLQQKQMRLF